MSVLIHTRLLTFSVYFRGGVDAHIPIYWRASVTKGKSGLSHTKRLITRVTRCSRLWFHPWITGTCHSRNRKKAAFLCLPVIPSHSILPSQPGTSSPGSLTDFLLLWSPRCHHIVLSPCCGLISHTKLMTQSHLGSCSNEVDFSWFWFKSISLITPSYDMSQWRRVRNRTEVLAMNIR